MVKQITARPGQKAYLVGPEEVISVLVSGDTVLKDGDVVVRTTDGKSVMAVASATPARFGVVLRNAIGKSGKDTNGNEAYAKNDTAPIMTIGQIWVKPSAPVTDITSKVYVRTSTPTADAPLGSVSSVATDSTELPNATWETITNAEGLAIIRLRGA